MSDIRADKPLALLQAFIDDSGSDIADQRLFLAGYLNHAEKWALFSDAWAEELKATPAIEYLHMVEANNLRGQFKGWKKEDRDEKIRGLARVVRHFNPISFHFSISRRDYSYKVKPVAPRGIGNPHFVGVFAVVSGIVRSLENDDFIFDQQDGVSDDIDLFFSYMKKNIPRNARKLINSKPKFEDDKHFLPLQAADMLAWHIRREHEMGDGNVLPMARLLRCADAHIVSELDSKIMLDWANCFEAMPEIKMLQSKGQWQDMRREISRLSALGFVPPHGSRWKNALYGVRERLARIIRR